VSAYVPILAAERSWLAGLAATTDAVKDHLMPLFDVPAPSPQARGPAAPHRADAADAEQQLAAVIDAVASAFGGRRAFLDCAANEQARTGDGRLHTAWLLDEARARGLRLVPVTGLRRTAAHHLAAAEAASVDGRGVCLRLQLPDFADLDALPERVLALVDALGVAPDQTDLLVDLGRVAAEESRVLVVAARAVLSPLRRAARWRSVVLAAAGRAPHHTPSDTGTHPAPVIDRVPRTEWLLWRALTADAPTLGFGDYAGLGVRDASSGAAPDGPAADALRPRRAVADDCGEGSGDARDAEWLVVRAARQGGDTDGGAGAPPPLAGLPARPEFRGVAHRAGDAGLVAVHPPAADAHACGNGCGDGRDERLAAWRAAAITHHLTITVEGIARAGQAVQHAAPSAR